MIETIDLLEIDLTVFYVWQYDNYLHLQKLYYESDSNNFDIFCMKKFLELDGGRL